MVWAVVIAGSLAGTINGFFMLLTGWLVDRSSKKAAKLLADALKERNNAVR